MADERHAFLEAALDLRGPVLASSILTSGPQPGIDLLIGLPLLLIALAAGVWAPTAIALSTLPTAVSSLNRRTNTALASAHEFALVRNARFGRQPQVDERVVHLPITAVNIRIDRELVGSVRVIVNGTRYWSVGADSDNVRKLIRVLQHAQSQD